MRGQYTNKRDEGKEEKWPGNRRRGGPLHDEMAQGRGGEELATPHSEGRQEEQQPREAGGGEGG